MAERPDPEKLAAFFRELTPAARQRLASAMTGEAGAAIPFRSLILEPLRAAQRALGEIAQRTSPEALVLAPIEPFVSPSDSRAKTPGFITRTGREQFASWLASAKGPDVFGDLARRLDELPDGAPPDAAVEEARTTLLRHLEGLIAGAGSGKARNRSFGKLGEHGEADLADITAILRGRAVLSRFASDTPSAPANVDEAVKQAKARLEPVASQHADLLPFALMLTRRYLANPQAFARLAAVASETTDASRICETPYVRILDLLLAEAEREHAAARTHASSPERMAYLRAVKNFGAAARALSTEVDLAADGHHARGLAALKREMAERVRADLQDLSPRMRRLVRPRAQEKPLGEHEISRLTLDFELLLIARTYAEEIALNALSSRTFGEVRDLIDTGTPQLIERLRGAEEGAKPALREQLGTVVKLSAKIFGAEYAAAMSRAVDVAAHPAQQKSA